MRDSHPRAERDSAHAVADSAHAAAKRRRPPWIPTIAALVAVVLFVGAGEWQHRRLRESEALRDRIAASDRVEIVELPRDVAGWAAWRFRQVRVTGTFDAARQILVDNVIHDGRPGFDVVTPLDLDDGRSVLVDRGWFPLGESREHLPMPQPPSGKVTIRGRIDIPSTHYVELGGRKPPAGALWENLDPQRYAAATGLAVLPIVIDAQDDVAGEGLVRAWSPPDFGITMHQGYMLQWYTFAAMAAGLWAWFTLRPWWRARRMSRAGARGRERSR